MKSTILPIIFGLVIVLCSARTSVSMTQPALNIQPQISEPNLSRQQQEPPILSRDYKIAKQSLDKAISERDEVTLRLGLKKALPSFKKEIIQAVRNAWYQSFVPDLIELLADNQGSTAAKKEEREETQKVVISALMHLTGLRFSNTEDFPKNDLQKILEESRQWYRENEQEIQQALAAEIAERQQRTPVLSRNYRVAKWALDKAVSEQDNATIRLGLKGFSLTIKKEAVLVIKKLDDKLFIPDLIVALETNQGLISGGTESQFFQNQLNKEIVSALEQLTGLQFPYFDYPTNGKALTEFQAKDIERVLKESREWYKTQQP